MDKARERAAFEAWWIDSRDTTHATGTNACIARGAWLARARQDSGAEAMRGACALRMGELCDEFKEKARKAPGQTSRQLTEEWARAFARAVDEIRSLPAPPSVDAEVRAVLREARVEIRCLWGQWAGRSCPAKHSDIPGRVGEVLVNIDALLARLGGGE